MNKTCEWLDCDKPAVRTIWFGDEASGRDLSICGECFKKHFEE